MKLGDLYKHYTGGIYKVLHVACHADTPQEWYVVYREYRMRGAVYVRKLTEWDDIMFGETKRFTEYKR